MPRISRESRQQSSTFSPGPYFVSVVTTVKYMVVDETGKAIGSVDRGSATSDPSYQRRAAADAVLLSSSWELLEVVKGIVRQEESGQINLWSAKRLLERIESRIP